jgi:hypothetical protein
MTMTTSTTTTDMNQSRAPRRSRVILVAMAAVLAAMATGIALWFWFATPNTKKYQPLIDRLTGNPGEFEPNQLGRVDLSKTFPGLTPRDELFLRRRDDGSFVALMPTYYPKGIAIAGLLYTSRPLRLEDTYVRTSGTSLDRRLIDVGGWSKLSIDARIDEHWYRVSRGI